MRVLERSYMGSIQALPGLYRAPQAKPLLLQGNKTWGFQFLSGLRIVYSFGF